MVSIRRSLVTSLLLLLFVALAAVGSVGYSLTERTLTTRQDEAVALIATRYDEEEQQLRDQRDLELLRQAQVLAGLTQSQTEWNRLRTVGLTPLGVLNAAASPGAHLTVPVWLAQGVRGPLSYQIYRRMTTEVRLKEEYLPRAVGPTRSEFYQVTTEWGNVWRSVSLGKETLRLDTSREAERPLFDFWFDDEVACGVEVRRVVLKAPVSRYRFLGPAWEEFGRPRDGGRGRTPSLPRPSEDVGPRNSFVTVPALTRTESRATESVLPAVYIQCAWGNESLERGVAELRAQRDREIEVLLADTDQALRRLRYRFGLVALATFVAALVGGSFLVRRGLRPLKRVSAAVSVVSEKDFRLPLDPTGLPVELKPIVDRLTQTLAMLEEAFRREKQATADISHELRTPLAALATTLDVVLRKSRSEAEYRDCLGECREIARQMIHLAERILLLARIDAGSERSLHREVDLVELLSGCAAMVRPLTEARGLDFRFDPPGALSLNTDPDKLREVVLNLLHNAIEYNRPGGRIVLSARRTGPEVMVEVADTGIGIAPEHQDHIFERFYRSDPSRNNTGVHAGLGLSIVREYVRRLGGRIALESDPGMGTRFRVHLSDAEPLASPADDPGREVTIP